MRLARSETFEQIVNSHRLVRRFVARALGGELGPAVDRDLAELAAMLPDHFAYEERPGGMLRRIRALGPEGALAAARLEQEHRDLALELAILVDCEPGSRDRAERLRRFATRLQAHEALESSFVGRVQSGPLDPSSWPG